MRTCPHCLAETEADVCPFDGFATLASGSYAAPQHALRPGHTLNRRYKVRDKIGAGGFGSVYKGLNLAMDQSVAIKVLRLEAGPDEKGQVRRFHREARAASKLHHPNTIRVFDFGQSEEGFLFMVMEYVQGRPLLREIRDRGTLDPARVVRIIQQVLASLCEAHEKDIVHRDIKPENIMLTHHAGVDDHVKVLDFGIAKMVSSDSGGSAATTKGVLFGSPSYMAPELIKGDPVDARADLYAVGAVMYYMLAGCPPFSGETPMSVLYAHCHQLAPEVPPVAGGEPVPQALRDLTAALLSKDPAERPQTARATLALLRAIEADPMAPLGARDVAPGGARAELAYSDTVAVPSGVGALDPEPDDRPTQGTRVALGLGVAMAVAAVAAASWWWLAGPGLTRLGGSAAEREGVLAGTLPELEYGLPETGRRRPEGASRLAARRGLEARVASTSELAVQPEVSAGVAAPAKPELPPPTTLFFSASADARVFTPEGELLGSTPFELKVPLSEEPRRFVFVPKSKRLAKAEKTVTPDRTQQVHVKFARRAKAPGKTRPTEPGPSKGPGGGWRPI